VLRLARLELGGAADLGDLGGDDDRELAGGLATDAPASWAGLVEKMAATCWADVFLPRGTRKNVRTARKKTIPLKKRLISSPTEPLSRQRAA